jgi:16S rRNA (cytosine1402-N4)-methyltransferase
MKDGQTGTGAHVPVLLRECIEGLAIKPDGIYVDGTLGRAGHSLEIVRRLAQGKLIGIDRDETAIKQAGELLKEYEDRAILVRGNFKDIGPILDGLGIDKVDGMLFDLGVSSPQLDEAERGFSYMTDAPLDMRMDRQAALSAYDIVNDWPEADLRKILWEYGEERYAGPIASKIIKKRAIKSIETTLELTGIIREAMPAKALREKQHPAKRTFQAIRIAVNDELGAVREMLETAPDRLKAGGRLCVISFHSLEDRLVKNAITKRENGCTCPKDFPVCICGFKPTLKAVTKKPVTPSEDESGGNPRARSAKLRIAERLN